MATRSVAWLVVGAVVLLAVFPSWSVRFAVEEDERNNNDFGKSENKNGRWFVEDEKLGRPAQKLEETEPAVYTETSDVLERADDMETFEVGASTGIEEYSEVDGELVPNIEENDDMTDSSEEGDGSDDTTRRKKRAAAAESPQMTPYTKSIVGKTLNYNNLTKLAKNVKLTFNGNPINLAQFKIQQSDAVKLDNFLRGESLADRLYVVSKLAGIEQMFANAQQKMLTTLAIEDLDDDDIVLTPEDVDELEQSIKDDPSILDLNAQVTFELTNITQDQNVTSRKNLISPSGSAIKERVKRKITSNTFLKWPTTIPYVVTSDFDSDPSIVSEIEAAVQHWEDETCLNFVRGNFFWGSHLRFRQLSGCWSMVGRRALFGQTISIDSGCGKKGIIAHEIGHALGFWHEQSRPDRDIYVNINYANIESGKCHNFAEKNWRDVLALGVPYDYSSLMHYPTDSFSKNRQKTISAKEADMDQTLGSRFGLSFYDVKLANYRYCSNSCNCSDGLTWSRCRNDGYRDPKNCNKCKCPDGWTGTYCTLVADPVNAKCSSKHLTATSSWKTLSSPNYNTSGLPANSQCTWRIRVSLTYERVLMQFIDEFKVQSSCPESCENYVEVRHQDLARTGPRYCCSRPTKYFRSHRTTGSINGMLVLMRINSGSGSKGFKLRYRSEPCGGYLSAGSPSAPACVDTQAYTCEGNSTCYRQVQKCYFSFTLIGSSCYRTSLLWSTWSSCTKSCGACGTRKRKRVCLKSECSGYIRETEVCNRQACATPITISKVCHESYRCGGWLNRSTCYRYNTCYISSNCCAGKQLVNNQCI